MKKILGALLLGGFCLVLSFGSTGCGKTKTDKTAEEKAKETAKAKEDAAKKAEDAAKKAEDIAKKKEAEAKAAAAEAAKFVTLEKKMVDLTAGSEVMVKVTKGEATKAEVSPKYADVTAEFKDGMVKVMAGKDAKEGTATVKVMSKDDKESDLKVMVKKAVVIAPPPPVPGVFTLDAEKATLKQGGKTTVEAKKGKIETAKVAPADKGVTPTLKDGKVEIAVTATATVGDYVVTIEGKDSAEKAATATFKLTVEKK